MLNQNILFSVFTPIYNRKDKIDRVWRSLSIQTYKNFEWIIVDDGSTDDIMPLLKSYQKAAQFPITILEQQNSGKHIAWNRAVEIAKGELFVPADSDDEFVPETLETFYIYWSQIVDSERKKYSGINVLCVDSITGKVVGEEFPSSPFVSNNLDLRYKYKVKGEKWGCIRTECLRMRKNPEVTGGYLPETWMWFWLARRFDVLCVNEPLRIYYQNEGGNISARKTREVYLKRLEINHIYMVWHIGTNFDYISKFENTSSILKSFVLMWMGSLFLKKKPFKVLSELKLSGSRIIAIITFLPGLFYFFFSPYNRK